MNMNLAVVKGDVTERLARQIERLVGGRVTMLERQPRWRTSWYAEVSRDGRTIPLYIRGDKGIDAETFPGLAREAARSEEHTSELQSLMRISYAVFCLTKKNIHTTQLITKK